jgi:predicted XRE-type DNA-binding protein
MPRKSDIIKGSGNVFADLRVTNPEETLAKAELVRRISEIIDQRGLKQSEAAEVLGIDQAKVSALVRGRLSGFSTDRLFRFLNALGRDIEIVVRAKPTSRKRASVRVVGV